MGVKARIAAGFVVGPISPGLAIAAALVAPSVFPDPLRAFMNAALIARTTVFFSAALGYPLAICLGIPVFVTLGRFQRRDYWAYLVAGAIIGAFSYGLVWWGAWDFAIGVALRSDVNIWPVTPSVPGGTLVSAVWIPAGMVCGAIGASAFWVIARPDRLGAA
jgi:hypothetical protein